VGYTIKRRDTRPVLEALPMVYNRDPWSSSSYRQLEAISGMQVDAPGVSVETRADSEIGLKPTLFVVESWKHEQETDELIMSSYDHATHPTGFGKRCRLCSCVCVCLSLLPSPHPASTR
jgi:hypothetical protein